MRAKRSLGCGRGEAASRLRASCLSPVRVTEKASSVTATLGRPLPVAEENYNSQKTTTGCRTHAQIEESTLATCWSFWRTPLH